METIQIDFDGESVSFNMNMETFIFTDLDGWVRSRFGIKEHEQLRYMDKLGAESLPSKGSILETKRIYVKKVIKNDNTVQSSTAKSFNWFPYPFFLATIAMLLIGLYAEVIGAEVIQSIKNTATNFDSILYEAGIIHKPGIVIEAFAAVICWSSTYLFIRRLWNPETANSTIERFSADSFFGGLAAGFSVILKSALIKSLRL